MKKRDSQRSKVYRSEDEVVSRLTTDAYIKTVPEIQAWIDKIVGSRWAKKTKHPDIGWEYTAPFRAELGGSLASYAQLAGGTRVNDGRGRRSPCALRQSRIIKIPKFSRNRLMILHELAHIICRVSPSHGPVFCRILLELVRRWMSIDAYRQLRREFKRNKVKVSKKQRDNNTQTRSE